MRLVRNLGVAVTLLLPAAALGATAIVVHRDPGCVCCEQWAKAVRAAFGREVAITNDANRAAFLKASGVPADLRACHTAVIDGLAFEGHVPIEDIKRVLAEHPKGVAGLAVTGMPTGSLGMEMGGARPQPYDVISFGSDGQHVYAHHAS